MLTFDLETAPLPEYALEAETELEATGVVPSLHPITCSIVAASFGVLAKSPATGNVMPSIDALTLSMFGESEGYGALLEEGAEQKLIQTCLDRIAYAVRKRPLVTFDGKRFDLWILRTRAMLLGIDPEGGPNMRGSIPWADLRYPYSSRDHCDLRLELGNSDRYAKGTLSVWCDAFGVKSEDSGSEVWEWVKAGEWGNLEAYSRQEAYTLLELYAKVKDWL